MKQLLLHFDNLNRYAAKDGGLVKAAIDCRRCLLLVGVSINAKEDVSAINDMTMTIQYAIDANDFLTYQLFTASKSKLIQDKRRRLRLAIPILYGLFGVYFLYGRDLMLGGIFLVVGIVWYVGYPFYEKRRYLRHYRNFIREHYHNRFGKSVLFQLEDNHLLAKDDGSESKVLLEEIEAVNEIATTIFIKLKSGPSLIFPKQKISNIEALTAELHALAARLSVPYTQELNWQWR